MDTGDTGATEQKPVTEAKRGISRLVMIIAGCILFYLVIPPTSIPLVMLIVGFIVMGVLAYSVMKLVLVLTGLQARLRPMQRRAIMLLAVCLPLLLLMMQSLGQLTIRDTLTLGGLFVVGVFYILRVGRLGRR
jgi:hypothetical protein